MGRATARRGLPRPPQGRHKVWEAGKRKESWPGLYQPPPCWEVTGGIGSFVIHTQVPKHGASNSGWGRVCVCGGWTAAGTRARPGMMREERLAGQVWDVARSRSGGQCMEDGRGWEADFWGQGKAVGLPGLGSQRSCLVFWSGSGGGLQWGPQRNETSPGMGVPLATCGTMSALCPALPHLIFKMPFIGRKPWTHFALVSPFFPVSPHST